MVMLVAAVLIVALLVSAFYNSKNTNSNEIDTTTLENYLSNQTNINQYDLINGLEPDEIDSINTTVALEDGIIEDILVGNGSLENL
jgi:FtsZ-interacting cell division protein ZipA